MKNLLFCAILLNISYVLLCFCNNVTNRKGSIDENTNLIDSRFYDNASNLKNPGLPENFDLNIADNANNLNVNKELFEQAKNATLYNLKGGRPVTTATEVHKHSYLKSRINDLNILRRKLLNTKKRIDDIYADISQKMTDAFADKKEGLEVLKEGSKETDINDFKYEVNLDYVKLLTINKEVMEYINKHKISMEVYNKEFKTLIRKNLIIYHGIISSLKICTELSSILFRGISTAPFIDEYLTPKGKNPSTEAFTTLSISVPSEGPNKSTTGSGTPNPEPVSTPSEAQTESGTEEAKNTLSSSTNETENVDAETPSASKTQTSYFKSTKAKVLIGLGSCLLIACGAYFAIFYVKKFYKN